MAETALTAILMVMLHLDPDPVAAGFDPGIKKRIVTTQYRYDSIEDCLEDAETMATRDRIGYDMDTDHIMTGATTECVAEAEMKQRKGPKMGDMIGLMIRKR